MQAESRVWVDAAGGRTILLTRSTAGAAAIAAAVVAASEADWLSWWESNVTVQVPAPAGGNYQPVSLRAALTFVCADTTLAVLRVPAPAVAMFMADGQSVDPAAPLTAAIVAAAVGSLVSATGSLATAFVSGVLEQGGRTPP